MSTFSSVALPRALQADPDVPPPHRLARRGASFLDLKQQQQVELTCYVRLQRGLVKEVPLSALAGTRLGIDANHYLRRLLTPRDPTTSDAFLAAVGGAPLTLTAEVSAL